MILDIITSKWFAVGIVAIIGSLAYVISNRKDKVLEGLEREYNELLTAEQHKVKGQY